MSLPALLALRAQLIAALAQVDLMIDGSERDRVQAPTPRQCPKHPEAPVRVHASFGGAETRLCSICGEDLSSTNENQTQQGG